MIYVLLYSIAINSTQYVLVEPMQSLEQCRRLLPIIQASDMVTDAKCAAVILDGKREENELDRNGK